MNIGTSLKELRKEKGVTQLELSKDTGIARAHISAIESGRRTPKQNMLRKILFSLNIEYLDFILSELAIEEELQKELSRNV